MEKNIQFRKNFIWNIFGTGFNAFNSLFFLIIVTRINGVDNAGIFSIAFSTACIMYVIGIYAGRIYQVTELNKKITDKEYIINRIITTISMIALVILFSLIKGYSLYKFMAFLLLTVYKALEAFSEVIYGVLQKNEKLDKVGKSLFMKSIISVILFLIIDLSTKNMVLSMLSIIISSILILIIYDYKNCRKYIDLSLKISIRNIFRIFKDGFFTFSISFLGMYVLNAPKYAIDIYLEENYQTIFGIIVMPATVIGLVAQFLIHPYLNQILKFYQEKNLKNLEKIILKLVGYIVIFGTISSILAYLFGTQVLGFIYGLNLNSYRIELLLIIIASTMYTIGVIYSSVLTTVRETFSQFIIYILISIFALIVSNTLTKLGMIKGAVEAYLMIMAMQFIIYTVYTNIKIRNIFKKTNY